MNARPAILVVTLTALTLPVLRGPAQGTSTQAGEPGEPRQVTWEVPSDSDVKVSVVSMGLSQVIPVRPGFSVVWANEGYAATDYGPYNRLFLVYHSKSEMPHYEATFFLGRVHSVVSVKSPNEDSILIETSLHEKLPMRRPATDRVRLVVDVSEVDAAVNAPPEEEGNLDVSVKVTASEVLRKADSSGD